MQFDDALRARIVRHLGRQHLADDNRAALKRAAVCVIVARGGNDVATVVLTRRASTLSAHAGQFAFPGGRMDAGESAVEAGLREAREEVGLDLPAAAVLGRLDDYPTRSGYLITPLVVWAPGDAPMTPNPAEVAAIYRVPITDLELPGSPEFVTIPESPRPVIRYPLLGTRIHAPTAALLYQFVEIAVHGRDTRVDHLEQPVWAWK